MNIFECIDSFYVSLMLCDDVMLLSNVFFEKGVGLLNLLKRVCIGKVFVNI